MTQQPSFGQGLAIAGRVAEAFPRDIPHDEVQAMIDDRDFWCEYLGGIRAAYAARVPTIPDVGVEFELTLEPVTGLAMVKGDGYDPKGWKFEGSEITEPRTGRFKLVQVGYCRNLDAVRQKLAKHGRVPEGQWREAFKTRFTKPDGKGLIGVADPSWVGPGGYRYFPCVGDSGDSDFDWAGDARGEHWRWLVDCK